MLNQETIIKLAEQHGFKVGRDAGGEYVAPKYEDAVGSLVALVQAAYAMGQKAEPVAREPDFYVVTGGYNHMHEWCDGQLWIADKDDIKRLGSQFSYVGGYYAAQPPAMLITDGFVPVPLNFLQGFQKLAHNYSLQAQAPDYYVGRERDAFSDAYARCGRELAKLRNKLVADLEKLQDMLHDEQKGGA